MEILAPYDQILHRTDVNQFILRSGRVAGKTKNSTNIALALLLQGDGDVIFGRANYNQLRQSLFREFTNVIDEENLTNYFKVRQYPEMEIICTLNDNRLYFVGIGGSDLSRTKGFKPHKQVQMVFFDEAQQLPNQYNLDQARATLLRFLQDSGKFVISYNPEPMNMHWMNEYARLREGSPDWLIITATYMDIAQKLSKIQLRDIETERILNPKNYEYLYLGITEGLFGSVYFTFDRRRHYKPVEELKTKFQSNYIHTVLIGVDGASTRDKTALVPLAIMNNGQAIVLEMFYHDPIENGAMSNEQLVPYITSWLEKIEKANGLYKNNHVPIYFIADAGGNSDLHLSLRYNLVDPKYNVIPFGKKQIIPMAQNVNDVFSRNIVYVGNYDGIYDYVKGRKIYDREKLHPLVQQLESVVWNEQGTGFEKAIDNDATDAFTYVVRYWYTNPDNLYLPERDEFYDMEVNT
jgi:PBSX family phage terminase large subunit